MRKGKCNEDKDSNRNMKDTVYWACTCHQVATQTPPTTVCAPFV